MLCLSYVFSSTKPGWGVGSRQAVVQTMYTHVSKCKKDKIKERKKKIEKDMIYHVCKYLN
jgi:hypothetical protein